MVDPDRRPSAQEIEELIDLVRRDPASPAFIDLGEAYLALGRPRDAIQVGNLGLQNVPDNLEGRVMLARAYASLHQWKEAQGELLRVVKVDRGNRVGFALLGEVLLRRNDYERAVPVLQHAQNLDPTSPAILSMLRRARAGQPLDPPPPIPQPVPPRGETANPQEIQRSRNAPATIPQKPGATPRGAGMAVVPTAAPAMPTMALEPAPPGMGMGPGLGMGPGMGAGPAAAGAPTLLADPGAGYPAAPAHGQPHRSAPKTAPPPMSVEGIRPRVISTQKQQNAAAASLRQSAAVGETYLNDLLTGGLLDVAGVRVPDAEFDLRPDRRWGRSTRRAFIFLFVVLVLGIGGGGTWYWWNEQQKGEAVARLQRDAKRAIGHGEYGAYDPQDPESRGLEAAIGKLNEALQIDKTNLLTFAYVVEVTGLEALLYGKEVDRVERAIKAIEKDIQPGARGERELVIGKAAVGLARLYALDLQAGAALLVDIHKLLDGYIAKHESDKWAKWLKGRALLASGERKAAAGQLKVAGEGEDGLALALIDRADLLVDDGQLDEALDLYKKAHEKSKHHPLLVLGRALARAEAAVEDELVVPELNEKFNLSTIPPRAEAYRHLALALANIKADEWKAAATSLAAAQVAGKAPGEPRFWARVAWAYYLLGDLAKLGAARNKVFWFSKKAESDQTTMLVDAAALLGSGLPEPALELATKLAGPRPRALRVYANLDLGKYKDAKLEAEAMYKDAPQLIEAEALQAQARMMAATTAAEREEHANTLDRVRKKARSKLPRHALGVAWLAAGSVEKARPELELAITDVSEETPNPVAYRTLTALAEVALLEKDPKRAGAFLDWSLGTDPAKRPELVLSSGTKIAAYDEAAKQRTPNVDHLKSNSGYFPTRAMQSRVLLRANQPDTALELLQPLLKEAAEDPKKAGAITPAVKLTLAEAL
ncbi:MAG TPA: tetratricopeptide repeat protein, partial [Kofleriaceae bacterium]|nr:tetratricopeptide repeat protein [Kofleriaceae bacterium]